AGDPDPDAPAWRQPQRRPLRAAFASNPGRQRAAGPSGTARARRQRTGRLETAGPPPRAQGRRQRGALVTPAKHLCSDVMAEMLALIALDTLSARMSFRPDSPLNRLALLWPGVATAACA